jgi:hypothetical protein
MNKAFLIKTDRLFNQLGQKVAVIFPAGLYAFYLFQQLAAERLAMREIFQPWWYKMEIRSNCFRSSLSYDR